MPVERIDDVDSGRLVAKLQAFVNWWEPRWFPPLRDSERLPQVPPALEWALRFPPDFFSLGEFVAEVMEAGQLQCFQSYGEQCDGFISDQTGNPVVRFETDDHSFEPTRLNDFVVGTVLMWLVEAATTERLSSDDARLDDLDTDELALDVNLIWQGAYIVGRIQAWLSGETLVVESTAFGTTAVRRPSPERLSGTS